MNDEKSNCTVIERPNHETKDRDEIASYDIKRILLSHESVKEADVTTVSGDQGKDLLHANILLNKDHSPSNELKLELAWHVGAESGDFSVFKDIEFRIPEEERKERWDEQTFATGIVHIAGHRVDTSEVEQALMDFDGVVYARVIGVPDKKRGETLKAFITLKDGMDPSNDLKTELGWHARIEVSPMVVFKEVEFGDFVSLEGAKTDLSEEGKDGEKSVITTLESADPDGMVIVDEIKEDGKVIRISSHKISTTEITQSLLAHPYISDAAVVTVPDDRNGETMKAFVKLKEGVDPSNDLKLELAWHVMTDLKPISVFKSIELETAKPEGKQVIEPAQAPASPVEKLISKGVEDLLVHAENLSDRVENILAMHDSVSEAIVISVKDKVHGQALQAFVTLNEGSSPTEDLMEELAWHARTEIGSDVVFKSIKFRRFFPVTESRESLEALLTADAMEIPTMMSITIAD
jgi:acyl-coenzyme A synthetase/AMP-(fatty) acid ligase